MSEIVVTTEGLQQAANGVLRIKTSLDSLKPMEIISRLDSLLAGGRVSEARVDLNLAAKEPIDKALRNLHGFAKTYAISARAYEEADQSVAKAFGA